MHHGFHGFGHQMRAVLANRLPQPIIERCSVSNRQSMAAMPLSDSMRALFRDTGFAGDDSRPMPDDGLHALFLHYGAEDAGRLRYVKAERASYVARQTGCSGQLATND